MTVDGHAGDARAPLRILVVGGGGIAASDLVSGLDELDMVEFTGDTSDLWSAVPPISFDVVVIPAIGGDESAVRVVEGMDAAPAVPIVALCNGSIEFMVELLQRGIDDVDRAPIPRPLLVARIDRIRRLRSLPVVAVHNPSVLDFGTIRLDRRAREISVGREALRLTPTEYKLLEFLMAHAGECLSRDQILDAVWGINFDTGTNLVDMYVYFVRKRLKTCGVTGVLRTVRGAGYRFVPPEKP